MPAPSTSPRMKRNSNGPVMLRFSLPSAPAVSSLLVVSVGDVIPRLIPRRTAVNTGPFHGMSRQPVSRLSSGIDDRPDHADPTLARSLLQDVAAAVSDLPGADPTVECITHRFTAGSKDVLLGWYPEQSWRWTSRRAPASSASTAPPSTSVREKSWPSCGPGSKASWPQRFPRLVLFIGRSRLRLLLDLFERKPGAARAKETDVEA